MFSPSRRLHRVASIVIGCLVYGSLALAAQPPDQGRADEEQTSVTKHTIRIGGQPVAYTATAGTQFLRDDAGKPIASMFYVYYARDGVTDLARRPIVYSFNGGPGTASIWMHMGFTGPRRAVYDEEGFMLQPPFRLHDNEHSILDLADIVYIDPVGTGYSKMLPGQDAHKFHGVSDDIAAMGDFIRIFTQRQGRWPSPKFLIGESYGTTRASGLAGYLQSTHQMYLNGVILVSMTNLQYERGADLGYATVLPYMTATAWYHKKLAADLQAKPLEAVLAESEKFAVNEYQVALFKGGQLGGEERAAVAKQLARLTGLSARLHPSQQPPHREEPFLEGAAPRQGADRRAPRQPLHRHRPRRERRGSRRRPRDVGVGRAVRRGDPWLLPGRAEVEDRRQVLRVGERAAVAAGPGGAGR